MSSIEDKVRTDLDCVLAGLAMTTKIGDIEAMYQLNTTYKHKNTLIYKYLPRDEAEIHTTYQRAIDYAILDVIGQRMKGLGL